MMIHFQQGLGRSQKKNMGNEWTWLKMVIENNEHS
jgi:hypothetical protein